MRDKGSLKRNFIHSMNSNQSWELKIDKVVFKELSRFPEKDTRRIFATIVLLAHDPYFGDIEKIKGEENSWRRRSGAYRIFYDVRQEGRVVEITRVERRVSNTY